MEAQRAMPSSSHWGEGGKGVFEKFEGAVLGAPMADVGEVEFFMLNGKNVLSVFDVFGAFAAF